MRSTLSPGKGKGSSSPRDGCFLGGGAHVQRDCNARTQASNRLARANRASHGPRVRTKGRVKRTMESPKEPKVKSKVPKAHSLSFENSTSETSSETQESAETCTTDKSWFHDGWSPDDWNDDWSSVGWHEGCEQTHDNSASSFFTWKS